jgi:hypothetical protein
MRTWAAWSVVLLVAVALVVVTSACLVHADDDSPDVCASLVAVTLGLVLALSLDRSQQIAFARPDGYPTFSIAPPAPPPKA